MKKRFFAVFLALALCVGLAPTAFADDAVFLEYIQEVSGGTITYGATLWTGSGKLDGWSVNKISEGVTEVTLLDRIEYKKDGKDYSGTVKIQGYGLAGNTAIVKVTLPKGITEIGSDTFKGCTSLASVIIPDGVVAIRSGAFSGCTSLTSVTIPSSVVTVGSDAFKDVPWLNTLGDLAIVGKTMIRYNGAGGDVTIPAGVTSIAKSAFENCSAVTSVTLPAGLTSIDARAFCQCKALTTVNIPSTVTAIGFQAFESCSSLTSVDIPSGVTEIALSTFSGCTSLTNVTIPSTVTSIGYQAFRKCSSLTTVTIPDGVTSIGSYAFYNCESLTNVDLPASVTKIDMEAFKFCSALTSVSIPSTVTSIGNDAFAQCPKLTVHVAPGSYAESWAKEKGITCVSDLAKAVVFNDLKPNAFYLEPVKWAVARGITTGKTDTTFAPGENCTHGQILTFLWRAAGEPASNATLPFAATGDEYYLGAAKWAYEKGMIGADFNHKTPCTRAYAVQYIWQAFGKPAPSKASPFTDIPAHWSSTNAAAWAAEKGVTTGTTATTFSPNKICNRGEIVTFLYRAYSE